ncbi:MAG TPA: phytoene desaturase family protein [Ilumatobacter sp.]|nr:phytoene desaturase family protein [Ilumatobacter sp.]
MPVRIVVIGAGLGGLSAACHLAGAGHDVTVIERAAGPGGRAGSLAVDGYRFETGPTVLTMPSLFERCFDAVGVDMSELLTLRPLEPMYRACFADGTELRVRHGREAMAEEIRDVCGVGEAAAFHRFADWLTALYETEMPCYIERNYDSPLDLVRPFPPALRLLRLGAFRRLDRQVGRFFDDQRLRRVFSFQALYAGLAPQRALALYAVITYMDAINGVVVADGGMQALPIALATAAERGGARFRYNTPAERIVTARHDGGQVTGVRLAGGECVPADVVICNADLPGAYESLLPGISPPQVLRRGTYAPSAVVWHAGVRGSLPERAAHHNIHFGRTWRTAFRALLQDGRRMPDPSLLVSIPSIDEPQMAPSGGHSLYVLEPVPNLDGGINWATERTRVRDDLGRALARFGYPTDVEVEALADPTDWRDQGLARGTPFGLAHTFRQTGPFRPANVERRVPGLFFVGSSTVPGVGVPMVIVSGELAARRVAAMERGA